MMQLITRVILILEHLPRKWKIPEKSLRDPSMLNNSFGNSQKNGIEFFFVFLEREIFNLCRLLLMIAFYHQTKTPISFWCIRGLNLKSLIQPSKTLPVELVETHKNRMYLSNLVWMF